MKVEDFLIEAPQLFKKELIVDNNSLRPFVSNDAIKESFDIVSKIKDPKGIQDFLFIILRKTLETAYIGYPGPRDGDNKLGLHILSSVEFKKDIILSGSEVIKGRKNVLQVNLIRTPTKEQAIGYGQLLYLGLAKAGYVIISDYKHYDGGKKLWKKNARLAGINKYKVYVADKGVIRKDQEGNPIIYDGNNIDDCELWSENSKLKYTLFILKV